MNIRITRNSGRRCAWTDRKNGYFEFLFSEKSPNNGYYRSNRRYFKNFSISGHELTEAKHIDVMPLGFCADYNSEKLNVSLLLNEQAFYISGAKNPGIREFMGEFFGWDTVEPANTKAPVWKNSVQDGITIVSSSHGFAIAANFHFYTKVNDDNLEIYSDSDKTGWYFAIEETEEEAVNKAVRLVKENGIQKHTEEIIAFLQNSKINTGDKKFDDAVMWARFSGWMLATMDHDSSYRGIWAGLPWFRDNWGRDTFISLCGTLLTNGCFEDAKNVLLGFAGFQCKDASNPSYGRIPNRYRSADDVIYNTIDGTLWFIRALWEYVNYSGDTTILGDLLETVETALNAEIKRCDGNGFLKHGDADTWMDARIKNNEPLSPRGDRANDIQALWFNALLIGARIVEKAGKTEEANTYREFAKKVKRSFTEIFWNKDCNALADHLPEGGYGEWSKDMRPRPNQLFTLTVPFDEKFVEDNIAEAILENVNRELVSPFGLFSLTPEDPTFHPEHEFPEHYHKDAAYHNGTIWEWNSGAYITSAAKYSDGVLPQFASSILLNEAKMILDWGCAGSLSENIHAAPDPEGNPQLSGTFSQAWSVAEFVRNIDQDLIGFKPVLSENRIEISPCFPADLKEASASYIFGDNWKINISVVRKNERYISEISWNSNGSSKKAELSVNGQPLPENETVSVKTKACKAISVEKFGVPAKWITSNFPEHDFTPEWNGAVHNKDYLFNVIQSGRLYSKTSGGEHTGALEWLFDSEEFSEKYSTDIELGAIYAKTQTIFRLWAPTARTVSLILYPDGTDSKAEKTIQMTKLTEKGSLGVWEAIVEGDLHGKYYEFGLYVYGVYNHTADPYAKATGINGKRSMVVDMSRTNPEGWENVKLPVIKNPCDVVAYEAHISDISSSSAWNGKSENRRLFSGACETGTSVNGVPSGFDHIKSLGVTHVQLLPIFDFRSVDESKSKDPEYINKSQFGAFNWGYDPENYGCLEGSYSSDPYNGEVRIKEFKKLVKTYADNGIGIVMDVVFNHVNDGLHQSLGISVPGYFFRVEGYSGAGEDTASEREMFRKYMVNMLSFWLSEYKLCGFRFDLMGLHDVETMNAIEKALRHIKGDVLIYGEGWNMYNAGKMISASQNNAKKMPGVGHFNDAIRCAIKGTIQNDTEPGFIHNGNRREAVKFGIVGATKHPQIDYKKVEGTGFAEPWSEKTWTSVNYTEIHDNITLNDKLRIVEEGKTEEYYEQLAKMAISLVMVCEGMPILHAGMEFLRTKRLPDDIKDSGVIFYETAHSQDESITYLKNSYNACDRINALDWSRCAEKQDVVNYVKKLIQFRKAHVALRIPNGNDVAKYLEFADNMELGLPEPVLAWCINSAKVRDSFKKIYIAANPLNQEVKLTLPEGSWSLITDGIEFLEKPQVLAENEAYSLKPKTVTIFAIQ